MKSRLKILSGITFLTYSQLASHKPQEPQMWHNSRVSSYQRRKRIISLKMSLMMKLRPGCGHVKLSKLQRQMDCMLDSSKSFGMKLMSQFARKWVVYLAHE